MPVDILSIAPPNDTSEVVPFGGSELKVHPLTLAQVARLCQRFAGFRKVYFNSKEQLDDAGLDIDYRAAAMLEAYAAIVAAGMRKDGARDTHLVEAHIEKFPQEDITRAARVVLRLTNGEPDEPEKTEGERPLQDGGAVSQVAAPASTISPPQSNS